MASMFRSLRKKAAGSSSATLDTLLEHADRSSPEACLEVYQSHWHQALFLINKPPDPSDHQNYTHDEIQSILVIADKMSLLLAAECEENHQQGLILCYMLSEDILHRLVQWATSCGVLEVKVKGELLKMCETLVGRARQNLLYHKPVLTPILRLLHSSSLEKNHHLDVQVISVLHSVCLSISKSLELLDIFFNVSLSHDSSKFLVFALLIPYVHREGFVGQQAREALLLIMVASVTNQEVCTYIADQSDFCALSAAGLCGLYSSLPRKLWPLSDDWHSLRKEDYAAYPDVNMFLNSLEFCNAVVQVAHSCVKQQLVAYIYDGFLIPVVGPALHQNSMDEIIAATAYLELMLRHVSEPTLMRAFLKFILEGTCDEILILDSLTTRINSSTSRLCLVSLSLFLTVVDFGCEDAMFKLVFQYLIPCGHVMGSQRRAIGDYDIYGQTAQKFLSLVPNACQESVSDEEIAAVLASPSNGTYSNGLDEVAISHLTRYQTNYTEYLAEAHSMVAHYLNVSKSWLFAYDGNYPPMNVIIPSPKPSTAHYDIVPKQPVISQLQDTNLNKEEHLNNNSNDNANGSTKTTSKVSFEDPKTDSDAANKNAAEKEKETRKRDLEKVLAFLDDLGSCPLDEFIEFLDCIESGDSCSSEDFDLLVTEAEKWEVESRGREERRAQLLQEFDQGASIQDVLTTMRRQSAKVDGAAPSPKTSPRPPLPLKESNDSPRTNPSLGPFLTVLLNKTESLMQNSLYVNLLLTGLLARLAAHPQPLLRSLLLSPAIVFQPSVKSLLQVLDSVKHKVDMYAMNVQNFKILLLEARKYLMTKEEDVGGAPVQGGARGRSASVAEGAPKSRMSFTDILFRRQKPAAAAKESSSEQLTQEKSGGFRFTNKAPNDQLLSLTNRLETLKTKNAVYCAVVLEEFAKELAAISQEQAIACCSNEKNTATPG